MHEKVFNVYDSVHWTNFVILFMEFRNGMAIDMHTSHLFENNLDSNFSYLEKITL